jgi:predicted dinucleotide-binding enzyme
VALVGEGKGRTVRVGIIGSGRIGANIGKLLAKAGHEVVFSFSRDPAKLETLAAEAGDIARVGSPGEAAEFGEVVVLSVPWALVDEALEEAGSLEGKVLIDTTNQYTRDGLAEISGGKGAAEYNAGRARGARLVKAYNTLTAGFQAEAAGRAGEERAVVFYAGEDEEAKSTVSRLIDDSGFEPVDVGGWAEVEIMEAPRRDGSVYGEEYRPAGARRISAALREGDREEASRLARELKAEG